MKNTALPVFTFSLATLLLTSFTATYYAGAAPGEPGDNTATMFQQSVTDQDRGKGKGKIKDQKGKQKGKAKPIHPFHTLKVPPGHLPPPGECKVWLPGTPPGHQPPAQSCATALRDAPLGAWVITHDGDNYKVNIFNPKKRNVIDEVRYYEKQ